MRQSTQRWKQGLRLSRGVQSRLERAPAFLLIVEEVARRHSRDLPSSIATGEAFTTTFSRDDLPGGALELTTVGLRGRLSSELSFATGGRS